MLNDSAYAEQHQLILPVNTILFAGPVSVGARDHVMIFELHVGPVCKKLTMGSAVNYTMKACILLRLVHE
jgi:hypothetical protein